jgi:hypothetical protein
MWDCWFNEITVCLLEMTWGSNDMTGLVWAKMELQIAKEALIRASRVN